jgi:serine/threonine-protein kinase
VQIDPRFAQGWAALSYAHSSFYHEREDFTEERLALAREAADKALALQPDLKEGHRALGYYYYWGRTDYAQALEEFRKSAGGDGNDPDALEAMAYVLRRSGRWDESIAAFEKSFALNPRNVVMLQNMSETYQYMRRYPEAVRTMNLALSLEPNALGLLVANAFLHTIVDGDTRVARESVQKINPRELPAVPGLLSYLDTLDGDLESALRHMNADPEPVLDVGNVYMPKPVSIGLIHLEMNDPARAKSFCESGRQILEKAIARSPRDARMRASNALALACLGRKEEAIREARLAADLVSVSIDAVDGSLYQEGLARVYAIVGESDAACDILEKLLSIYSNTHVSLLRRDPDWTSLRSFPRFQALLEKYR